MSKHIAYIGLGSNLDSPLQQLHLALEALHQLPESHLTATSSVYTSQPVGPQDQPDFLNMAVALETALEPLRLLDCLLHIEDQQGRVRERTWGPRTLDLDLLLYADQTIEHPRLSVPHPEMANREFVLTPLLELDGSLTLPDGTPLQKLHSQCPDGGLTRLASA